MKLVQLLNEIKLLGSRIEADIDQRNTIYINDPRFLVHNDRYGSKIGNYIYFQLNRQSPRTQGFFDILASLKIPYTLNNKSSIIVLKIEDKYFKFKNIIKPDDDDDEEYAFENPGN